jgi:hypothetical protein
VSADGFSKLRRPAGVSEAESAAEILSLAKDPFALTRIRL